jgi:hypothetical protein
VHDARVLGGGLIRCNEIFFLYLTGYNVCQTGGTHDHFLESIAG